MKKRLLTGLLASLMMVSCSQAADRDISDNNSEVKSVGFENVLKVSAGEPEKVELGDEFITALSDFSEKIYVAASEKNEGNLILSPLSVMYALSLCSNGASGETLGEFETLLGRIEREKMNNYLYTLTNVLAETEDSTVKSANSVWGNADSFEINEAFCDIAHRYYFAEAKSLPFSEPSTVEKINGWVSGKTDGMIKNALDSLDDSAAMVILNTVLFDGVWEQEYEENDISDGYFTNYDGIRNSAEFMYSTERSYFTVDGGEGFSKAYKDGYIFTAVLPYGDIREFVASLDVSDILDASGSASGKVRVGIPKFEYESKTGLNEVLQSLGFERAFTASAELGGLQSNGDDNLMISEVLQKAKIITNEHGTKAAAVTEIMVNFTAFMPENKEIYLDRPFFYMITSSDGAVLFMGTLESME
ncbi:MAG: serpin family protein [Eubacteriales bacterium]